MSFNSTYAESVGVTGSVIVKMCTYGAISSKNSCVTARQDAFLRL